MVISGEISQVIFTAKLKEGQAATRFMLVMGAERTAELYCRDLQQSFT